MKFRRWSVLPLVATAAAVAVLFTSGCAAWRIGKAAELARQSTPYQQSPADATLSLLIVGDSTGVGTGASAPANSLAGLLGTAYPRLRIDNRARDGATFADVVRQFDGTQRYDLVLVQAGGNDVIRLRADDDVRADIDRVTALARVRADRVVLMPAGNVGNAPFFFPPASWLMTDRARRMHGFVRESAARHGALYVSLFKDKAEDPFVQAPGLHAVDGLHPSDAGYRLWRDELLAQSGWGEVLNSARAR
ncbi:GDSL-type esterase/lipase family protein [Hydrogenophaga sp.]|uniref:SGNH/GDSL hydrolase family protein n=1 Tax=Hydrogenophaga sp. TaxID=1904254 RepID=UPI002731ABB0|nr:GDSL-type esterase/lipase family protein [Hydrogenophaga sp.]MDP1685429.1 GDSL-type esterase/lipase family protein [Hydrogenophaga sp.]